MGKSVEGYSLRQIAEALGGEVCGDPDVVVTNVATSEDAGPGDISVAFDSAAFAKIAGNRASAVVVLTGMPPTDRDTIRVAEPRHSLIALLNLFHSSPDPQATVDSHAFVSAGAKLGKDVSIGAGAFVADDVVLGDSVRIHPNVFIGEACEVGESTEIFPNVTVYPHTRIGERVRIHAGAVIGSDGFGYMKDESGVQEKIPQIGSVEIGNDVEIGANCTVDRATIGTTRIMAGTKLDNLIQVGHNSSIGRNSCIVAQVGIAGSVSIGDSCTIAGQAGISDHVKIADGTVVGAQSGVLKDLTPGKWVGTPVMPAEQALRAGYLLTKLPDLRRRLISLEKRLSCLEENTRSDTGDA